MSLGVAWVLFGAIVTGASIIAHSNENVGTGLLIALTATILSKCPGKWYFWKKKD